MSASHVSGSQIARNRVGDAGGFLSAIRHAPSASSLSPESATSPLLFPAPKIDLDFRSILHHQDAHA